MPASLGEAVLDLSADNSQLQADLDKAEGLALDKLNKIGGQLTKVGGKLSLGVTTPIVGLGAIAVSAASSLEESLNKVKVVFGDSAGEIEGWSATAATALGQSQQQALEAAGTYGNLLTSLGLNQDAAADMSKNFVILASDLASFNNASPEETLLALRSALTGEFEPMKKFGAALNAAAVQEKAVALGLIAVGEELTPAARAQAAYALILEQTTNAQGDFARTADSLANSQRTAKAEFTDAAAKLGTILLPIITQATKFVTSLIQKFNELSPGVQKAIVVVLAIAAAIGPLLVVIGALIGALTTIIPVVGTVVTAIGLPVIAAIAAIIAVIALLAVAWKNNWFGIQDRVKKSIEFITGVIQAGLKLVQEFWDEHGDEIIAIVTALWENIKAVIDTVLGIIRTVFDAFSLAFQGDWRGFGEKLREAWDKAWELITNIIRNAWDNWKVLVQILITKFIDFIKNTDWKQVGIDIIHGIANGITAAASFIQNIIRNVLQAAIDAAKGFLGIESPSKVFTKIGKLAGLGFAVGLQDDTSIQDAIKNILMGVRDVPLYSTVNSGYRFTNFGGMNIYGVQDRQSFLDDLVVGP